MATSPCQPISPAVTHTLSWQVEASPHTSENFQVGYLELATPNEEIEKFTAFLISNGVTGTPTVAGDGVVRHASVYIEPNTYPCSYRLRSGLGLFSIEDGTYNRKEFRNLIPYEYIGNSSDDCIVIDYNLPTNHILVHPRKIGMNAIRAIDHVNATICRAYPVATRVIPDPPPPLQIDAAGFDANENISMTTSFRIYAEYRGPDGQFTNFINAPSNMWTYAQGKNEAILDWGYEYKPYRSLADITTSYYGSIDFIKFFFDDMNASQIQEGQYEILNYPWRLSATGNVTYEWGAEGVNSFPVTMTAEAGAITVFNNFYRDEDYLHNHTWYIKFLRFVSSHFEITTTPPTSPKITNLRHEVQTIVTPNIYSNNALYPNIYTYILKIDFDLQYATENTRDETTITEPSPGYEKIPVHIEENFSGARYEDIPDPVPTYKDIHNVFVNLATDEVISVWGYTGPGALYFQFKYKIKVYYESIGQYLPEGVNPTGFVETEWHGALDQDQPDQITEDFYATINLTNPINIKSYGKYSEGEFLEDFDYYIENITIDCSKFGGFNYAQYIEDAINWYKRSFPYYYYQYIPT